MGNFGLTLAYGVYQSGLASFWIDVDGKEYVAELVRPTLSLGREIQSWGPLVVMESGLVVLTKLTVFYRHLEAIFPYCTVRDTSIIFRFVGGMTRKLLISPEYISSQEIFDVSPVGVSHNAYHNKR